MTREELQNKFGDAICEYCNKNIISKYNIGIGGLCEETIDEAPMAYKPTEEIVELIKPTVDVIDVIKPIYNFKAKSL